MGALALRQLGKAYKQYPSPWQRLLELLLFGRLRMHRLQWVLRDVNLEVRSGESVGIVGMNGAGKSTLLKLVTGTTTPTEGTVSVSGRVAAILELGIGFHPEFTGRQNALLGGMLLGLSPAEIHEDMGFIEAFAEIGEYMDRPLRTYSSGMQMRLAFSLATSRRPDLLIVDEALSVGDAYFQHKSFARIREFRDSGTTILFVSHDPSAVKILCDRAVLLESGKVVMDDAPDKVLDYYNGRIAARENRDGVTQFIGADRRTVTQSGTGEARIERIEMLDRSGSPVRLFDSGQEGQIRIVFRAHADIDNVVVGIMIRDRLGIEAFGTNTYHHAKPLAANRGKSYVATFRMRMNLGPGSYSITAALTGGDTHLAGNFDWMDALAAFDVINRAGHTFVGMAFMPTEIEFSEQAG